MWACTAQDFGYWYHGNKRWVNPNMGNCSIAVDRAHRGNGALQVIRGSHRLGRLEHGQVAEDDDGNAVLSGPTGPPTYDFREDGQYGCAPASVASMRSWSTIISRTMKSAPAAAITFACPAIPSRMSSSEG